MKILWSALLHRADHNKQTNRHYQNNGHLAVNQERKNVTKVTSAESNLTKRPHRRSTWTVQPSSPGGANVHSHLTHANSLDPAPDITSQTASRSAQPFCTAHTAQCPHTLQWAAPPLQISPSHEGIWTPI